MTDAPEYRTVPVEPTEEMIMHGILALSGTDAQISDVQLEKTWRAMLSAAPPPPSSPARAAMRKALEDARQRLDLSRHFNDDSRREGMRVIDAALALDQQETP